MALPDGFGASADRAALVHARDALALLTAALADDDEAGADLFDDMLTSAGSPAEAARKVVGLLVGMEHLAMALLSQLAVASQCTPADQLQHLGLTLSEVLTELPDAP